MPLSAYERAIRKGRRDLLKVDSKVRTELARAYEVSKRDLTAELTRLLAIDGERSEGRQYRIDRIESLLAQIEQEQMRLAGVAEQLIANGQSETIRTAVAGAVEQIQAASPALETSFVRLPTAQIESLIGQLGNGSPMRTLLTKNGLKNGKAARERLTSAIAAGKNPRAITKELATLLDRSLWDAERIARDAMLDAGRNAALATYQANDDILKGWAWTAALSERTCLCCLGLHNRTFSLKHQFFPKHPCCRCSPRPLLIDDFGAMPDIESGAEWLARQPEATRRKMLPVALYDRYEAGEIILADFVQPVQSATWGPGYRVANIAQVEENARRRDGKLTVLPRIPKPGRVAAALPPRDDDDLLVRMRGAYGI